jgi:hypothetical protein
MELRVELAGLRVTQAHYEFHVAEGSDGILATEKKI